ncbi:gb [Venturia nashicola]|nr:gb [Venturia nashicola]
MAPLYDQIVLFGDSITEFGETCNGAGIGYVAALRQAYVRRLDVVNRGFSGYNTNLALRVMHRAIPSTSDANVRIVGLFFGANDSCFPTKVNNQCVPLPEFKSNLIKILRHPNLSGHNARIFLITNPPVIEEMQYAIDQAKGYPLRRTAENTKKYADAIREVGKDLGIPVVDLWSAIMLEAGWNPKHEGPLPGCTETPPNDVLTKYLIDGLHLTPLGYDLLHNTIMECIARHWPDHLPDNLPFVLPRWDAGDAWKMRGETDALINHRIQSAQPQSNDRSPAGSPPASL